MKRLSGFSLMEMMTVLLIVSIVAVATAPMINKKMMTSANNTCPWVNVNNGIAYNTNNGNRTVNIGTADRNNLNPRLNIRTDNDAPQITLEDSQENIARLFFRNGTFGFTNSNEALGTNAIAIGGANARSDNSIAIGTNANIERQTGRFTTSSIAIGDEATVSSENGGIAIGTRVNTLGNASIAIGSNYSNHFTKVYSYESIAIGNEAIAGREDSNNFEDGHNIAIGNSKATGGYCFAVGLNSEANGENSIAIGRYIEATGENAITIGGRSGLTRYDKKSSAIANNSIAIGSNTKASGLNSIAIGGGDPTPTFSSSIPNTTEASGQNSIAIGTAARATAERSTAIGYGAIASTKDQIVLGTHDSTVYIPGKLIVGNRSYFGSSLAGSTLAVAGQWGNKLQGFIGDVSGHGNFDILNPGGYNYRTSDNAPGYDVALRFLSGKGWTSSSDRRLKNVGKAFVGGLEELKKLDLFHYTYKKDKSNTPHVGVMAQDLQKVFPDAVTKGDDGFLYIRMEDMFYALINAVKELAGMFDKQDEKIVQLEKENKQLQKTVADLEKRLAKLEKSK